MLRDDAALRHAAETIRHIMTMLRHALPLMRRMLMRATLHCLRHARCRGAPLRDRAF